MKINHTNLFEDLYINSVHYIKIFVIFHKIYLLVDKSSHTLQKRPNIFGYFFWHLCFKCNNKIACLTINHSPLSSNFKLRSWLGIWLYCDREVLSIYRLHINLGTKNKIKKWYFTNFLHIYIAWFIFLCLSFSGRWPLIKSSTKLRENITKIKSIMRTCSTLCTATTKLRE